MILRKNGPYFGKEEVVLEKLVVEWLLPSVLCGPSLLGHPLESFFAPHVVVPLVLAKNSLASVVFCAFAGVLVHRRRWSSQAESWQLFVSEAKASASAVLLYHSEFA